MHCRCFNILHVHVHCTMYRVGCILKSRCDTRKCLTEFICFMYKISPIKNKISPARETAGISNPDAALPTLPLSILGVPGPEYSLTRSARLAVKASEQQVYITDPDF